VGDRDQPEYRLRDERVYRQALWRLATLAWLRWKREPTEENARIFRLERERAEAAGIYSSGGN
jgi:hypothetical protein